MLEHALLHLERIVEALLLKVLKALVKLLVLSPKRAHRSPEEEKHDEEERGNDAPLLQNAP